MRGGSLVADEPEALQVGEAESLVAAEAGLRALQSVDDAAMHATTLAGQATRPDGEWKALPGNEPGSFLSYQLAEKIGAGGMGTVHKAVHVWLGRTVAIKFISPALLDSPDMLERFRHEALAIGRLAHPNIVQATDAGRFNGMHYLVTEFVEGVDLSSLVRKRGWLDVTDACEVVRQAALGLAHAHAAGIVHRDVKPGNLLLAKNGIIKLLDFGLARLAAGKTTLTNTGQILGTLDFLAPEQANDARQVDPRGDQYSLGCTLYYLLTGEAPFSGPAYESPASKLKAHLVDQPRDVRELRGRVPQSVATIVERMMAKDPGERYGSMSEVADSLMPHCRDAELARLLGGGREDGLRRCERPVLSLCGEVLGRAGAVLSWAFRRRSTRQATGFAGPMTRQPVFSLTGLAFLGLIGFGLSKVSCVEIQEQGPPGPDGKPTEAKLIEFGFGNVALPGVEQKGKGR